MAIFPWQQSGLQTWGSRGRGPLLEQGALTTEGEKWRWKVALARRPPAVMMETGPPPSGQAA